MSEIDFDELDKAVSNLMGKPTAADSTTPASQPVTAPSTAAPADQADTKTAESATSEVAPAEDIAAAAPPTTPEVPSASAAAVTPIAQRRGQFMDVMHPSAKMRSQQPQDPRPRVSRQGPDIAPRPSAQEAAPAAPDVAQADTAATAQPPATSQQDAGVDQADNDQGPEPLSSPFLADAKVDKRPLGSKPSEVQPSASPEPAAPKADDSVGYVDPLSQSDRSGEDTPPDTPLPAELSSDIMQVESAGATVADKPAVEPKPSDAKATTGLPTQTSIPPQYKAAKPKTPSVEPDAQAASMYDLGDAPLKVPAKKKSSWPIVIGALILIALGVIGSVGLFLLNHS